MDSHLTPTDLSHLFNPQQALPQDVMMHLNECELCGRVFRTWFVPEEISGTDTENVTGTDAAWVDTAFDFAFTDSEINPESTRFIADADNDYRRVYLRLLSESAPQAERRLSEAQKKPIQLFFDNGPSVSVGIVSDLQQFFKNPDFTAWIPASRFKALAAVAADDAPKQFIAEGKLPNSSAYKVSYQPFETLLEIEAFALAPPRVSYYRVSDDLFSFTAHSAIWTSAKPDKWVLKLSPDHPAIVSLPEWEYVILIQSYKTLQK